MRAPLGFLSRFLVLGGAALTFAASAHADLLISEFGRISRYRDDGSLVKSAFITLGTSQPGGLLVRGSSIYVSDIGNDRVGKYTFDGTTVNASFITTGLAAPGGLEELGGILFVANYDSNSVTRYVLATGVASGSITTGVNQPIGVVASGGNIFVANFGTDTITRYALGGVAPTATLSTGVNGPTYLGTRSNGDLLVSNFLANSVASFPPTATTTVTPFVGGVVEPEGVIGIGTNVAVVSNEGTVRLYNSAGALVNASFITGLFSPNAIAYLPVKTPYPGATVKVSGRKRIVTTKARLVLKGQSTGATSVEVKVGKAKPGKGKGVSPWRYSARLKTGKNVVVVRAFNPDGAASAPARVTILRR